MGRSPGDEQVDGRVVEQREDRLGEGVGAGVRDVHRGCGVVERGPTGVRGPRSGDATVTASPMAKVAWYIVDAR